MSSDSEESHASAHNEDTAEHGAASIAPDSPIQSLQSRAVGDTDSALNNNGEEGEGQQDLLSIEGSSNGLTFARHRKAAREYDDDSASDADAVRPTTELPPGSPGSVSTPDDTPSIQDSILSSPGSSLPASHSSFRSVRPHPLQPFERRFSARLSPSPLATPRATTPVFLSSRSRQSSVSSNRIFQIQQDEADTPQAPWEVVRWTKLKKITGQVFSEVGKRNFGRPTCLCVAASLVIGTSKGYLLVFDYQQVLKAIIGPGTKAIECGPVTALAITADHTTVAGGHATGHIFTWELSRPAKPFLHIPPIDRNQLDDRRSDGHVSGVAILHIGFLGTRHTALVSADDGGMAFSHLATRGLGAIARTVKITRILGRYPLSEKSTERPRKPSSVLAFAPLPLGNVEQPTDDMGLTALLTPYLLVIVSTTPLAQTQHKAPRPKEIAPHSALSGCLAWFPAVKLKKPSKELQNPVSKTKLVYCWSNVLTILDVDHTVAPPSERQKPTELHFEPRSRWKCEEAIVAVQWLSRSVLGVLTISQRLIILEDTPDTSLRMTDSFDLLQKHIYHSDLFSRQLRSVIEHLNEDDSSMHGVIADAFYMSFRAYKGRLFLLGVNDVSIGTLSNWADRLIALMDDGDFISAIQLATSYYVGDTDKLTVGLPADDNSRHAMVQEKLIDMISASLKYVFAREDAMETSQLADLTQACFTGCISMKELDFLFEDIYEIFEENSGERVFFETLEPYILDEEVTAVPPNVLKDLITFYTSAGRASRLEEMICCLNTDTMDINQVTTLCEQYNLYDALIYVWTRAIGDFITPFTSLLSLLKLLDFDGNGDVKEDVYLNSAIKIFPYMAYTLTGRVYPGGTFMDDSQAYSAKKDMYRFLFSGGNIAWPPGSGDVFFTRSDKGEEPSFPYLRMILDFDASSFMSMLNEAFEDSFLNEDQDNLNGHKTNGVGFTPTRQYIINTLLGIMTTDDFDQEDILYFYMFIARNLPKYPQHILLPGTSLHNILTGLCSYPTDVVKDDCQLSIEYLLSVYHPPDMQSLIPLFQLAGYHRVLKSVYRGAQQYAKLVDTYLNDTESGNEVFACIAECLRPSRGLHKKQINEIKEVLVSRASDMGSIDAAKTAQTINQYAPDLLEQVLDAINDDSDAQYHYLQALVEPTVGLTGEARRPVEGLPQGFVERYVQLMCKYNSTHVADFVGLLKSGDLKLDPILPALEQSGIIDAAVVLLARDGFMKDAMDRLTKHLGTLESALTGLVTAAADTPDPANTEEAIQDLLNDIQKYDKVGIWLCQGQTKSADRLPEPEVDRRKSAYGEVKEEDLTPDELSWLELVDTTVQLSKNASAAIASFKESLSSTTAMPQQPIDTNKITTTLRSSVQQTFSALLASTSIPRQQAAPAPQNHHQHQRHTSTSSIPPAPTRPSLQHRKSAPQTNPSFLRILRAFLSRAADSSPSLSDLRNVLAEIFAAYTFEETILSLANRFLEKEGFVRVEELNRTRTRGWRPRGQVCEGCNGRVWGPGAGAGGDIWEAWMKKEGERVRKRDLLAGSGREGGHKGKGRSTEDLGQEGAGMGVQSGKVTGPLVLFACRHLWHKACLEKAVDGQGEGKGGHGHGGHAGGRLRCPLCV